MSESNTSIVQQEREASAEQATALAVANLERSGLEGADLTLQYLTNEFTPLQKMRGILESYGSAINKIVDNVDADEETRVAGYAELRAELVPQYEEAAAELAPSGSGLPLRPSAIFTVRLQ